MWLKELKHKAVRDENASPLPEVNTATRLSESPPVHQCCWSPATETDNRQGASSLVNPLVAGETAQSGQGSMRRTREPWQQSRLLLGKCILLETPSWKPTSSHWKGV